MGYSKLVSTVSASMSSLVSVAALAFGGILVLGGHTTPGSMMAVYSYGLSMTGTIMGITKFRSAIQGKLVSYSRLQRIDDACDRRAVPPRVDRWMAIGVRGLHVTDSQGDPVLRDAPVKFTNDQIHFLVGPNGAGKTTLAEVLLGIRHPEEGEILANGEPIDAHETPHPHPGTVYIRQDSTLLNMSIRDNLRLGHPEATSEDMLSSCRSAGCEGPVRNLPCGLDTVVGAPGEEGTVLSAGQVQRLLLARALFADPGLLVIDESLDAIDSGDRYDMMRYLSRAGILTIIITHDARVFDGVDGISCALWRLERCGVGRLPLRSRAAPLASPQLANNDMIPGW